MSPYFYGKANRKSRGFLMLEFHRAGLNPLERFLPYRRPVIVALHMVLITVAYLLAFLLRFEFCLPAVQGDRFLQTLPLLLLFRLPLFGGFHLDEGLWRYVSMRDILTILKAVTISSLIFLAGVLTFFGHGFPRSVFLLDWVLCLVLVGGVRLALRESNRRYRQGLAELLSGRARIGQRQEVRPEDLLGWERSNSFEGWQGGIRQKRSSGFEVQRSRFKG